MPTYEYACSSCQHEWEFEQSIKDAALTECPRCQQQTARRQISRGTGFILKGGGWYADLYSSSGNKPAADAKPSGGTPEGSSGSSDGSASGTSGSAGTSASSSTGGSSTKSESAASAA